MGTEGALSESTRQPSAIIHAVFGRNGRHGESSSDVPGTGATERLGVAQTCCKKNIADERHSTWSNKKNHPSASCIYLPSPGSEIKTILPANLHTYK